MFDKLAKNGRDFEVETRDHVNKYADAGLRTLILAYRVLDEEEYKVFNENFSEAKNSVSADRETLIDEVTETIEKDLVLLGATAVEDKLQNGVSQKNAKDYQSFEPIQVQGMGLRLDFYIFFLLHRFQTALTSLPKLELRSGF